MTAAGSAAVPTLFDVLNSDLRRLPQAYSPVCSPNCFAVEFRSSRAFDRTKLLATRKRDVLYTIKRIVRASLFEWNEPRRAN
jgi:hypothetical protein